MQHTADEPTDCRLWVEAETLNILSQFTHRVELANSKMFSTVSSYRAFACILLPWKWRPFWCTPSIDFSMCTKMAAMAVAKLLPCCDIICKRSILE